MLLAAGLALLLGLSRPAFAQGEIEPGTDPRAAFGITGTVLDDRELGDLRGTGGVQQKLDAGFQTAVILWDERGRPRATTSYSAATGHDNVQSVSLTVRAN